MDRTDVERQRAEYLRRRTAALASLARLTGDRRILVAWARLETAIALVHWGDLDEKDPPQP